MVSSRWLHEDTGASNRDLKEDALTESWYTCTKAIAVPSGVRCLVIVNDIGFEVLDIQTCTRCETFHCKQATSFSHVNVIIDRGSESEIQAVLNIGKKWFLSDVIFKSDF